MLGHHSIQQMLSIQHDTSDFGINSHLKFNRASSANHLFTLHTAAHADHREVIPILHVKYRAQFMLGMGWGNFVAIAILHQTRPTDSADINTRLQLSDTSSIPPMHGGFLLLPQGYKIKVNFNTYIISWKHINFYCIVYYIIFIKPIYYAIYWLCFLPQQILTS